MQKEVIFALGAFALIVFLIGGAVWLANAPMKPPSQSMHLVLPDERVPR